MSRYVDPNANTYSLIDFQSKRGTDSSCAQGGCKFFCVYGGKILPIRFRYVQQAVELWD